MIDALRMDTPPVASILLVDDSSPNLLALSAVLRPLGARLVEARSGKEALAAVAQEPFAVVLLDVQMPEMDGFEVAERMREMDEGRELPILFLTAIHRDDAFVKRGYSVGGADYITKPFDADVVRARVRAFVSLFEQREAVRRAQVALRTQERDEAVRRLVAFERIATAALSTQDLSVFLRELLQIFMGAADAADSATILLREGEELRVFACVGLNEEVDEERYAVPLGESFAGRVAAEKQPIEIANAAESTLVRSEWLRARGTKALYGVPLLYEGEVLGVAHIGSIRSSGFSETDKRLLGAITARAAWAVSEHMKRARLLELERTARVEAEAASRMKDAFLATVSHELRTPLNAILGWTVTARTKSPPPEIDRALSIIERNGLAQARIIDDVLDMSRVIRGKLRLEVKDVAINEALDAALDAVRPAATAKEIEIARDDRERFVVRADLQRLQQVIWNILSNAIKFAPKGGHVRIALRSSADTVTLEVVDDGEGIAPEFLPRVFEPFWQEDTSTTRRHSGLGLGLAIVKHIVDAHGGTISAASGGQGKGSTFTIALPAGGADTATVPPSPQPSAPPTDVRLAPLKILVVDDDEDARAFLVQFLTERGAVIGEAESASKGFEELRRFQPDILVSDVAMPGGDGYGLIRAVRRLPAEDGGKTPAIALTAHARIADGERAYAAGFQAHLAKPVDLGSLVSLLADLGGLEPKPES